MQPKWKCIANLGDVNPLEYGGLFIFIDETGVYTPEMERLEPDEDGRTYTVHRVVLERCTFRDGVLSDNASHPEWNAWFVPLLPGVASATGSTVDELRAGLCSADPIRRAWAWGSLYDVMGWDNGDAYPLLLTHIIARKQVEKRYPKEVTT